VERQAFRQMANYSGATFLIIVAAQLRFKTDAVVIGTFLSSAAITHFYAGSRLVDYAGEVVSSLAQIFVPMSSQSDAAGNMDRLRKIFIAGNRVCAFTIFPMSAAFVILGKSIIEVWVGKKYVVQGYPVLLALIVPYTIMLAQSASSRILFGISKHGVFAVVALIEGMSNVILSVLLVRRFGILGDAFGTAIPMAATYLFFVPWHLCARLRVPISSYLAQAYLLPVALCTPIVLTLILVQKWFVPHSYSTLAVQLLIGGAVYAGCLAWAYLSGRALHVREYAPTDNISRTEVAAFAAVFQDYEDET